MNLFNESKVYVLKKYVLYRDIRNGKEWAVFLFPLKSNQLSSMFNTAITGFGNTLPEADINFRQKRISNFTSSSKKIHK